MNAKRESLNHLIPYESFVNTILGGCLCLKGLQSTRPHYEVYAAQSLFDRNQNFAVRAYTLRGLAPRVRAYRIRNLNRAATENSCLGSLEQGGKKWLVFTEARAELVPESLRDCGPVWRARDDYERAFPVLEPQKLSNFGKSEKQTHQDEMVVEACNARVERALKEELLSAYQVIDGLRELLVTSFNSCHHYEEYKLLSEERKKIKSPEQEKRLRDRQRLSRQTKRRAKAALKPDANASERGIVGKDNEKCCY